MAEEPSLKLRTARTIKWNLIDKVSSQVLYAVTGWVLANRLSEEDFGLVGTVLIFQAFANIFVDSGFSSALLQRKNPTQLDYSSVLWFNITVATFIYAILWLAAPLIAIEFNDMRLIDLSRVMFLAFIINATAIVQTNRLMKQMTVRMIAISNFIGLIISSVVGIYLALNDFGAWAVVWQTITLASVKSLILWITSHWLPSLVFSLESIKSIFNVGVGVMGSSLLNTLSQKLCSIVIGLFTGMRALGYYTQADKWSVMGTASLSQVVTASFLPVLSQFQDDRERFNRAAAKMNRFTAYVTFPAMCMLIAMATPIFHLLFGTKWDASIALFQILLLRGIFTILTSLYNNYIVALGRSSKIIVAELVKDIASIIAIVATLPYMGLSTPDDPTQGLRIMLWGQLAASAITWLVTLKMVSNLTGRGSGRFIVDLMPYMMQGTLITVVMLTLSNAITANIPLLCAQFAAAAIIYLGINAILRSTIQQEMLQYIFYRFIKNKKDVKL